LFLCLQEHLEKIAVTMGKEHLSRSELCNDPAIIKDLVKKLTRCQCYETFFPFVADDEA
jgi:hypothetical protein